jgi:hypothetical protein
VMIRFACPRSRSILEAPDKGGGSLASLALVGRATGRGW